MATKTRAQLIADATANLLDNEVGLISEQDVRDLVKDLAGSFSRAVYDVSVTDYGAVLDGVTDDTAALVAAAADIRAAGKGTLWFPPGSKCLVSDGAHTNYTGDGDRTVLLFNEAGLDVEIAGNGTEIIFDGADRSEYANFIYADNLGINSRIEVHGLIYKYNNLPFVTGTVNAISAGSHIDFDLDQTPTFSDVRVVYRYENNLFDVQVFLLNANSWSAGGALTLVSGSTYRLDITSGTVDIAALVVGDEVVLEHQNNQANFFLAVNAGIVDVHDNEIHHAAGMGFRIIGAHHARACRNHIPFDPALRAPHSLNRDGIHFKSCHTVEVFDNSIQATTDDCIHVNSMVSNVSTRDSDTQLSASLNSAGALPYAGSLIQALDSDRVLQLETRVVSVDSTVGPFQITVADTLPAGLDNTWQVCLAGEVVHVCGNSIGLNRGRGIIGAAREWIVNHNTIVRPSSIGIQFYSDADEYTAAKSYSISGNTIRRANLKATGSSSPAVIEVKPVKADGSTAAGSEILSNGSVLGNLIDETNNGGLAIYATSGLIIANNVFHDIAQRTQPIDSFNGGLPIVIKNVDQVYIAGNVLAGTSTADVQAQDATNVIWGTNFNILPSKGTNPVTFTSPKGFAGDAQFRPSASVTPSDTGDLVVEATNNTTLTFRLKGSDGTVRSGTVTLS